MFSPKMIETEASKLTNQKFCLYLNKYEGVICDKFEVQHFIGLDYSTDPNVFMNRSVVSSEEPKKFTRKPRAKRFKEDEQDD